MSFAIGGAREGREREGRDSKASAEGLSHSSSNITSLSRLSRRSPRAAAALAARIGLLIPQLRRHALKIERRPTRADKLRKSLVSSASSSWSSRLLRHAASALE